MKKIIIASHNPGKIKEYRHLLEPLGFQVLSLNDFPMSGDIDENGTTFRENALKKAKIVADRFDLPTIADDSGLEVYALGMQPGVYSKRYSDSGTDHDNNTKLLSVMQGITDRRARFFCQIVYYEPGHGFKYFAGSLEGTILFAEVMGEGFGYDPIFFIPELDKPMSRCTIAEKNRVSHRGKALRNLLEDLEKDV